MENDQKKKNKKEKEEKISLEGLTDDDSCKDIVSMYDSYRAAKEPTLKRMRIIKSFYDGDFWEKFKQKIKEYTITPDTNYIEYVVTAFVNSIYSSVYIPRVIATDLTQVEMAEHLSAFLEREWRGKQIKSSFIEWGINASLYNFQAVKEYPDIENNKNVFETISPFGLLLDPSVNDYKDGEAIFIVKETNIYKLLKNKRFKEKVKEYIEEHHSEIFEATEIDMQEPNLERHTTTGSKTVSLIEYYIRREGKIENGFLINREKIIFKKDLLMDDFPIEILYNRKPTNGPYGIPLIYKILNSYIALNLLDSMDATLPYIAQNRPKFFDLRSRINARSYKDYGNSPDATFPLMGEPSKAIHYQDVQFVQDTTQIKNRLEMGIQNITGVDMVYRGRQTNSIITTGGVEAQQARVIMLTDNSPIVALETFVERLGKLDIAMAKEYLDISFEKVVKDKDYVGEKAKETISKIDLNKFNFVLESKPFLPMTKETLFEKLKMLYEMQGQYNFQIKLLQEEDLIEELPVSAIKKSKLLQRISSAKQSNAALKKRETLLSFASLFQRMKDAGLSDEESATEALKIMDEEDMMREQDPSLGVNPTAMPPQGGTPQGF